MTPFSGLNMSLGNLARLSSAKTRSISAENPTGGKGAAAMADPDPLGPARLLGRGWKCAPFVPVVPGETVTLAEIDGPGVVQSMWFGGTIMSRDYVLRIYWDNASQPAVECPLPDFFASPWTLQDPTHPHRGPFVPISSLPVAVNPNKGMNCFWEMPFRERCRITLTSLHPERTAPCFYQINYALTPVPDDVAMFHAQFRRTNPLPRGTVYCLLDGVRGPGHYVGTSLGVGVHSGGWWGEGEINFYIDGDDAYPTICGTGTEDYFGGSYNFEVDGQYVPYSTPFMGMHVLCPDGLYHSQHRHALYRWHIMDPIRFEQDLRVTLQSISWGPDGCFRFGEHDICSVAYWYQALPTAPFPPLPDRAGLEII